MKKIILLVFAFSLSLSFYSQGIDISSNNGDLLMRRFASGDLVWKRALVTTINGSQTTLNVNFGNDYNNTVIGGNVGIGTGTPLNRLQISNAFSFHDGGHKVIGFGWAHGGSGTDLNSSEYASEIRLDPTTGKFSFGVSSTVTGVPYTRLLINKDGNVGIGSNNPDEKLTVKGTVHCQEVKVDLSVPADYVFQKYYNGVSTLKTDYTMPTLEEVAAYTKANHHLPAMPSAKEIQENGLHLKEMTNLLLQKIEELTLYTIEQEKRINALEAKLVSKQ